MKLYHGTNKDFDRIDLLKSKPNKDFGCGFYLSADYEQALNMAQVKVEQLETGSPIVQSYLVEDDDLDMLSVLRFDCCFFSYGNSFHHCLNRCYGQFPLSE